MSHMSTSTYYVHAETESLTSKAIKWYLRKTDRKNYLIKTFETKQFNHTPAPIPSSLQRKAKIKEEIIQGRSVWTLEPLQKKSTKIIFFTHGGGHMNNIIRFHWDMVEKIMVRTGATFVVPDYPLLPDAGYKETYEMVEESFYRCIPPSSKEQLIFMGDSAGGAIAYALAQTLRDRKDRSPEQILLLSPELDASKLHPDILPKYDQLDVMLSSKIFDLLSPLYVRDCPREHYLVSPALGNLHNLGKVSIFTGTHDIMHPYSLDLKQRLEEENIPFNFYVYPNMIHVWMAIPYLNESKRTIHQITQLINH